MLNILKEVGSSAVALLSRAGLPCFSSLLLPLLGLLAGPSCAQQSYKVEPKLSSPLGVFYFPGWKRNVLGLPSGIPDPWERIRAFPEREPLLGWYEEGEPSVMSQHLRWMNSSGIGFIVFDWYWGANQEYLGHALQAYLTVPERSATPYALMWANHGRTPLSEADFTGMVRELLKTHAHRPEYIRVNGQPIFFVQLPEQLDKNSRLFDKSATQLIAKAQIMARDAGLTKGIFFVAGAGAGPGIAAGRGQKQGYSAYFNYNYHAGPGGRTRGKFGFSHSYAELDEGYRQHWEWFMQEGDMPFIVPMISGWDKRAWGGSADPRHDDSIPSDGEFLAHLRAGKAVLDAHPDKTLGLGVLCCWNEFGEGSVVEPTKALGMKMLDTVRSVFGK